MHVHVPCYHILIIINVEEDINRLFLELRLDLNSPELELELKCPELELELKLIGSSGIGIGIGIENNGIGIGIELKKWNWPQPCTVTQFTVCAARNLTVFVADSPRCLEWSSMVAAVSRALRELSEPCLGWTREPRRQPKSLGARRQYSQAMANNVLPVMTGSPAFLTRPPPDDVGYHICDVTWASWHCFVSVWDN